jgi:hypothetical protein
MGFFKSIGNAFKKVVKSTVGKLIVGIGAVIAAPFTGGLSLLALPAILGKSKGPGQSKEEEIIKREKAKADPVVKTFPVKSPPPIVPSIASLEIVEPFIGLGATTGKKETVTLTGFYYDVNRISIPIDTDLTNVIVVPETFFPYVAIVDNHLPSDKKRYIS